jgi:hypothetical protein
LTFWRCKERGDTIIVPSSAVDRMKLGGVGAAY